MSQALATTEPQLARSFGDGWNRFWFTPADPAPTYWLRIAVGLLAALHLATLGIELDRWYSRDGLLSPAAVNTLITEGTDATHYHFTYLTTLGSTELWVVHVLAIVVALSFAAGLFTRLAGALTLTALLAYVHRVPQVAGHAEPVLAFLLAYLVIAPSGQRLSLDRWLANWRAADKDRGPEPLRDEPSLTANLSRRLIQVHLAMFLAMMGLTKLYGDAWWDGEAVWRLIAQTQSRPLDLSGLRNWEYLLNFWTHSIVYFELAFPVLIWFRPLRPWLVGLSALVWLSVILVTGLLVFGLTMIAASCAFWPSRRIGERWA